MSGTRGTCILIVTILGLTLGVISWRLVRRPGRKETEEMSPELEYCL